MRFRSDPNETKSGLECASQLPPEELPEARAEPKIDFTYSGQKKVDLGFGPSTAAAPASLQGPPLLTWEAMRKVLLSL